MGLTAVVLKQEGAWTIGALANHIWSVAGKGDRSDLSLTYMQPFICYRTSDAWTFTLNTESTYDWKAEQWSVPVNFQVSKLVKFGPQPVSLSAGVRYWAAARLGPRVGLTFLFPT